MRYVIKHGLFITWSGHSYTMVSKLTFAYGFLFISEVDSEEMAAFVSIIRTKLTPLIYLSPDKKYV